MKMHHRLDIDPIPKEKAPMYVNEPWLVDASLLEYATNLKQPDEEADNVRVYVPIDINRKAILRRVDAVIAKYEESTEENEMNFSIEIDQIISQLEIYDQIWYVREVPKEGEHSLKAIELVKEIIERLENIPDGGSEMFPFQDIDELKKEYLGFE